MLKKTMILSSLILFSIPNIFCSSTEECAKCMNEAAIGTCACVTVFCILAVEQNKEMQRLHTHKSASTSTVSAPKPQKMDDPKCILELLEYCLMTDRERDLESNEYCGCNPGPRGYCLVNYHGGYCVMNYHGKKNK